TLLFQAEDGIRHTLVTGVQTCALPISRGIARGDRLARRPVDRAGRLGSRRARAHRILRGHGELLRAAQRHSPALRPVEPRQLLRSEERRVGKWKTAISGWSSYCTEHDI